MGKINNYVIVHQNYHSHVDTITMDDVIDVKKSLLGLNAGFRKLTMKAKMQG